MILTAEHLTMVRGLVAREVALDPGAPWQAVLAELDRQTMPAREPVFRLVLPIEPAKVKSGRKCVDVELAPTMNQYASMPGWKRAIARAAVDRRVAAARFVWARWSADKKVDRHIVGGKLREKVVGGKRRLVVVTRRSSRRVDEISVDVAGGKLPIDRLVVAGVLAGDSAKWLDRRARWEPAPTGEGEVVIEVFDVEAKDG